MKNAMDWSTKDKVIVIHHKHKTKFRSWNRCWDGILSLYYDAWIFSSKLSYSKTGAAKVSLAIHILPTWLHCIQQWKKKFELTHWFITLLGFDMQSKYFFSSLQKCPIRASVIWYYRTVKKYDETVSEKCARRHLIRFCWFPFFGFYSFQRFSKNIFME